MYPHYREVMRSHYGYNGNPYLPWDYDDLNGDSYGASPVESFLTALGALGAGDVATQAGQDLLNSPQVQTKLENLQEECKIRAKQGVTEWMQENVGYLALAGAGLIVMNYLMLTLAVIPVVRPRR